MYKRLIMAGLLIGTAAYSQAQTSSPEAQTTPATPTASQNSPNPNPPQNDAAKPQADAPTQQSAATPAIPVTLDKSVDSKKAKAGDEIVAKLGVSLNSTTGVQIPPGTKVIGHIADSKAKSKGDPQSSLTFSFDKFVLKDGKDIPFKAVAQAIGPAQSVAPIGMQADSGGPQTPQGARSGTGAASSGSAPTAPASGGGGAAGQSSPGMSGANGGALAGNGKLAQDATGVVGMKGLTLDSQASASVLSSDSKSVKLDSGTQILLRIVPQ